MIRIISALILAVSVTCASAQELVDNPPDRHIVVPGDTLWGIAGKFLKQPWRWPEVWNMNRAEIKNPHLIYPGDIVLLDHFRGKPRLRLAKPVNGKVQPTVYSQAIQQVIPSIPPGDIEAFLSRPLVIEPGAHDTLPTIVATQEERMVVGGGDDAYVSGIADTSVEKWNVFSRGKPLIDPDTNLPIAHEAFFLGNARLTKPGEPATVRITSAKQEIHRGNHLLPTPQATIISYVPHRPDQEVAARIMSIYGGVNEGGPGNIVALNRGASNGLEIGHVLALFRNRTSLSIDEDGRRVYTPIPEERYALAFVFRVFDRVSYALVVESSKSVIVGDSARNP